jgi:type II secretory pathway component PulK
MPRRPAARSGMALILTLAAIMLAGGLALFLQARAVSLSRTEQTELLRERLRVAAAEAAREALWTLASDEDLQVDHLGEEWASPRETTREDGVSTWAWVEDAGRFFNWNNLSVSNRATRSASEILLDLMTFCGDFSPVIRVEALTDFVDADEEGAYETDFYRTGEAPFQPPNRILWAPAELLRIHEFSADIFRSRPTSGSDDLFGGDLAASTAVVPVPLEAPIPVNVNTASRDVLMGVTGLQQDAAVRAVLALRQVQPFESLAVLFMANPELATALEGSVGTASTYFRVRARASLDGLHCSVMAWVERDQTGDIRILQWIDEGGEG